MKKIVVSHETPFSLMEKSLEFNDMQYALPHLLESNKKYREENKEKVNEKHRLWAKEKFHCECGAIIRRDRKNEHLKLSQKHNEANK